jgi:hypothetical protein
LGSTRIEEQNLKTIVNRQMIGLATKPQGVYENKKNDE